MANRLSESWAGETRNEINDATRNNREYSVVLTATGPKKYVVSYLMEMKIAFKVISKGCGVVLITTDVDTCPKCGGSGRC